MIQYGVRRCDACSSEILGRGGADICYLCRLLIGNDPDVVSDDDEHAPNVLMFPGKRRCEARTTARSD